MQDSFVSSVIAAKGCVARVHSALNTRPDEVRATQSLSTNGFPPEFAIKTEWRSSTEGKQMMKQRLHRSLHRMDDSHSDQPSK